MKFELTKIFYRLLIYSLGFLQLSNVNLPQEFQTVVRYIMPPPPISWAFLCSLFFFCNERLLLSRFLPPSFFFFLIHSVFFVPNFLFFSCRSSQEAKQDSDQAINERNEQLTKAQTSVLQAQQTATIYQVNAEADAYGILASANAQAEVPPPLSLSQRRQRQSRLMRRYIGFCECLG